MDGRTDQWTHILTEMRSSARKGKKEVHSAYRSPGQAANGDRYSDFVHMRPTLRFALF